MGVDRVNRGLSVLGRALGWGLVLGFGSLGLVFASGFIYAPEVNPDDPLAYEWYTPFVFFLMFLALLIGFLIGCVLSVGVEPLPKRRNMILFALSGEAAGLAAVWGLSRLSMLAFEFGTTRPLGFSLLAQAVGMIAGLVLASELTDDE